MWGWLIGSAMGTLEDGATSTGLSEIGPILMRQRIVDAS
jgi:hypothetical protein